ncbi:MAG: MerR family transcriptional regulator [Oscillospiraceae bacterium]|nr:MerR family transcriptional regulator [Oscillospiraceae bacterium]
MRINEVEKLVGIPKKNIRFYEEQGLLHPGRESDNGYRSYSPDDLETLRRIRLLRKLAVPIEEIRSLQVGRMALSDCMARHVIALSGEQRNLGQIAAVCQGLADSRMTLANLDITACEAQFRELEEGGVRFMNVQQDKRKKMLVPILITAIVVLLMLGFIVLMIWNREADKMPWWVLGLMVALFAGVIVGVVLSLRERMREIKKGEEDEAIQY